MACALKIVYSTDRCQQARQASRTLSDIQAPLYPIFWSPPISLASIDGEHEVNALLGLFRRLRGFTRRDVPCLPAEARLGNSFGRSRMFPTVQSHVGIMFMRACSPLAGSVELVWLSAGRWCTKEAGVTRGCHICLKGHPGSTFPPPSLPHFIHRRRRVVEDILRGMILFFFVLFLISFSMFVSSHRFRATTPGEIHSVRNLSPPALRCSVNQCEAEWGYKSTESGLRIPSKSPFLSSREPS